MKYYRCATCRHHRIPSDSICRDCVNESNWVSKVFSPMGQTSLGFAVNTDAVNEALEKVKKGLNAIYGMGAYGGNTKPSIQKVIFNDPVTVVLWTDGTKTIVRCQEGDTFDPEKGLSMAITKKALGNTGNYYEEIKKWLAKNNVD